MTMRNVLIALMLMASPAIALDVSMEDPSVMVESVPMPVNAAGQCIIATESEFMEQIANVEPVLFIASNEALVKFLEYVNGVRAVNNLFPFEAEKLIIGLFEDNGEIQVGTVMIDSYGCVVIGSIVVMTAVEWAEFIVPIGISSDDFTSYRDA